MCVYSIRLLTFDLFCCDFLQNVKQTPVMSPVTRNHPVSVFLISAHSQCTMFVLVCFN